jgi:hypothetical protein
VSRIAIEVSNVDDDADTITRIGELVAEERRVPSRLSQGQPLTPEDERHPADLEKRLSRR